MQKLDIVKKPKAFIYKVIALLTCFSVAAILIVVTLLIISYFVQGKTDITNQLVLPILRYSLLILPIDGVLVFLLCSLLLVRKLLNKKNTSLRSVGAFYDFARSDYIVIDEGESLFNNKYSLKEVLRLSTENDNQIIDIVGSMSSKVNNDDPLIYMLQQLSYIPLYFDSEVEVRDDSYLVNYKNCKYILGRNGSFKYRAEELVKNKVEPYIKKGYEIFLVGKYEFNKNENKYAEFASVFGVIVAKNEINDDLKNAIKYFQNENKTVLLFSSGNAIAASEQAKAIGLKNAERYISNSIDDGYVVYGDLSKEQKRELISKLQKEGNIVSLYSSVDGIDNSNCSFSFSELSKAKLVISEKDTTVLDVYKESISFTNKLKKIFVVEVYKTIFVSLFAIMLSIFSLLGHNYDYRSVGLGSIFTVVILIGILFDNDTVVHKIRLADKIISLSLLSTLSLVTVAILYFLQLNEVAYTGINDINACVTLFGAIFAITVPVVLLSFIGPLNQYRIISCSSLFAFVIASMGTIWLLSINLKRNIMGFYFNMFNGQNNLTLLLILVLFFSIYFVSSYLVDNYNEGGDE